MSLLEALVSENFRLGTVGGISDLTFFSDDESKDPTTIITNKSITANFISAVPIEGKSNSGVITAEIIRALDLDVNEIMVQSKINGVGTSIDMNKGGVNQKFTASINGWKGDDTTLSKRYIEVKVDSSLFRSQIFTVDYHIRGGGWHETSVTVPAEEILGRTTGTDYGFFGYEVVKIRENEIFYQSRSGANIEIITGGLIINGRTISFPPAGIAGNVTISG